jgi:membrane-anchored protein YejM (alkaline phosphatase superfamily)
MWKVSAKKLQTNDMSKYRKKIYNTQKEYNKKIADSLLQFGLVHRNDRPYFVYAHLIMPHFPYFYNSEGIPYPDEEIYSDSMITDKNKFRNYIGYTNLKVIEMVDSLMKQGSGKDVIILQSDHGLSDLDESRRQDAFRNFSAFYFPDRDYNLLYHKMSNVNTFRIILNKYFGQQLPLLKDSSIYEK